MTATSTKTSGPISLDIVTVCYDSHKELERLRRNIAETTDGYKWIVVDNNSPSGAYPDADIKNDMNLGFATACNQGAQLGTAEYICFLNPDVVLRRGWAEVMMQYASKKQVGIVGPTYQGWTYPKDLVVGACMMMRREVFVELNGFDGGYFLGWEDNDICHRAIMEGYRIVQVPLQLVHPGGVTTDTKNDLVQEHLRNGKARYYSKFNIHNRK